MKASPSYLDIADYGVIGDLRTVALVGVDGSIDWCCMPRFDGPSLFGALLDAEGGGRFRLGVAGAPRGAQRYVKRTGVLQTEFNAPTGAAVVTDFMPASLRGPMLHRPLEIHRHVVCTEGSVDVEIVFQPGFDYAASSTLLFERRHGILATDGIDEAVALATSEPLEWQMGNGSARATCRLEAGDSLALVLRYDDDDVRPIEHYLTEDALAETVAFWRDWASRIQYHGPYRDMVERSAITLKLMCYARTGAMVAAATTSLPEVLGGERNWDYRFTWLRDSCFTLHAFYVLGHRSEADHFMQFVKRVCRTKGCPHLQIMYGIDGRRDLPERELEHLEGYRGSAPVRIGNGAADQLQLDVYGEVLETAYIWSRYFEMTEGTWHAIRELVDWVADNWRQKDSGMWEIRHELRHHVSSKVMCWVALDRGVRLAETHGLNGDVERWRREADACRADILEHGYSEEKGAFVAAYGSTDLDASALVIPMVKFLHRSDRRVQSTVRVIARELTTPDGSMAYRYRSDDGMRGEEGAFSICTFWLAQALAMIGDHEEGTRMFEQMLSRANHVGLYSEEVDPATGDFLGNFPQGLTHIALINCAHVLARLDPSRPPNNG
jgi:GH15 family glucan-1,4-alpha-glucosidase